MVLLELRHRAVHTFVYLLGTLVLLYLDQHIDVFAAVSVADSVLDLSSKHL